MTLPTIMKLLHVLAAFWLVTGVGGRNIALARAAKSTTIEVASAVLDVANRLEKLMVIPGSLLVLIFGLLTAWQQGWLLLGFLQGARSNWLLVSLLLFVAIMALVPLVFLPRGRRFEAALADAQEQGQVTEALTAAFADRWVQAAHVAESALGAVIIVLMVTKPF